MPLTLSLTKTNPKLLISIAINHLHHPEEATSCRLLQVSRIPVLTWTPEVLPHMPQLAHRGEGKKTSHSGFFRAYSQESPCK